MQATVRVLATILTLALPAAPGLAAQFPEAPAGPLSPLVLDDLHHFLEALEQLPGAADSVAVLQAVYIDRGTTGLKEFTARKGLTAAKLLDAIRADPAGFARMRDLPAQLEAELPAVHTAIGEYRALLPEVVVTPVYVLVPHWSWGGGEASPRGVLVWPRSGRGFARLVMHELAHIQQARAQGLQQYVSIYGPSGTLLKHTIREGTADFLAELAVGVDSNSVGRRYYLPREAEVWARFTAAMHGRDDAGFMSSETAADGQPRALGYTIGALIARSYWESAGRTQQALLDLLSVTDYDGVLARSGYDPK